MPKQYCDRCGFIHATGRHLSDSYAPMWFIIGIYAGVMIGMALIAFLTAGFIAGWFK